MTFTPRDAKDVSALVAKKLETYMNVERREERFDTQGFLRTTPKMKTLDLMYQMLDKAEVNERAKGNSKKGDQTSPRSKTSDTRSRKQSKDWKDKRNDKYETDGVRNDHVKTQPNEGISQTGKSRKKEKRAIQPKLIENSRRVVPRKEADRITLTVNKIFEEQDLDRLHVIHRYRPHSPDVAPLTENGKVAGYTRHVGSALHGDHYVDFYLREGLQTGKADYSKRLQRLKQTRDKSDSKSSKTAERQSETNTESGPRHKSRMHDILSPLASSTSRESLSSVDDAIGCRSPATPASSQRPIYTTFLSGASSRASAGNNGRLRDDVKLGYTVLSRIEDGKGTRGGAAGNGGYVETGNDQNDKIDDREKERVGFESELPTENEQGRNECEDCPRAGQESRADLASSEEYCKFSAGKNVSCLTESRLEDSLNKKPASDAADDELEVNSASPDPIHLREIQMSYKRYSSPNAGLLGLGKLRQGEAEGEEIWQYTGQGTLPSARSVQSEPVRRKAGSRAHRRPDRLGQPETSTPFPTTMTEDGSVSDFSFSTNLTSPRRALSHRESYSKSGHVEEGVYNSRPSRQTRATISESPEVPLLGLPSDLNDTNKSTYSQPFLQEEYTTTEQQRQKHPDIRANEGRVSSRAVERVCVDQDARAEVGADQKTIINVTKPTESEKFETESVPNLDDTEVNKGDRGEAQKETNNDKSQRKDSKEKRKDIDQETTKSDLDTSRVSSGKHCDTPGGSKSQSMKRKGSSISSTEVERGEDEGRNVELDRGHESVSSNQGPSQRDKKKTIQRGDDLSETLNPDSRLTQSAKRRGLSQYHTTARSERGLEKEYFTPVANQEEQYIIPDEVQVDDSLTEASALNDSQNSSVDLSKSSQASDTHGKRKKKSLRRFSKTSINSNSKEEENGQTNIEPALSICKDGRGDDSNSVASGVAAVESSKKEGNTERPVSAASQASEVSKAAPVVQRRASVSSRGSVSGKGKEVIGQGYSIAAGESVSRGLDENTNYATQYNTNKEKRLEPSLNEPTKENIVNTDNNQHQIGERPLSATSQKSDIQGHQMGQSNEGQQLVSHTQGINRQSSVSTHKSDAGAAGAGLDRPPPETNQRSAGKGKAVERPLSVASQKSTGKEATNDVSPSAGNQMFTAEGKIIERSPSVTSHKSTDNGHTFERPPSASNQRSMGKGDVVERPPSVASQNSMGKGQAVERPPSMASQRSTGKDQAVEKQSFVPSQNFTNEAIVAESVSNRFEESNHTTSIKADNVEEGKAHGLDEANVMKGGLSIPQQFDTGVGAVVHEDDKNANKKAGGNTSEPFLSHQDMLYTYKSDGPSPERADVPAQEKAFIDSDDGGEIVKAPISANVSLENENTVIDFRPSSASTAKSVGADYESKTVNVYRKDSKVIHARQPVRIAEVTESEGSPTPGRDVYQTIYNNNEIIQKGYTIPADNNTIKTEQDNALIVNLAEDRENPTITDNVEVIHPGMKKRISKTDIPWDAKSNELFNGQRKDADEIVERPPSVSSQKSAGQMNIAQRRPSDSSQNSTGKLEFEISHKMGEKKDHRSPSVSNQKSSGKVDSIERPTSASSQKSDGKMESVERPPAASSQKSVGKVEAVERPPSASSQKSAGKIQTVERPSSASSQKSAGKVETVERPPSASSQKSVGKVEAVGRPPSASSQKSAGKVETAVERPPSASSQKSAGKVEAVERPPSASSQKSVGKVEAVERPPSASSQKSAGKMETAVERLPSAFSQKSVGKVEAVERPPSASSQKSAGKVETVERPPSTSSQKVEAVERPPSASSHKSAGKVETVERPPSASSQKSAGKVETAVERLPSASSQKSAGKVEAVERPPSASSQKSVGKVEAVERPPSASSQKSAGKMETAVERPPSAFSQKSIGKVEAVERPPSASSQKSAGKVETVERPPSTSSQKSAGKVETVERPPSASSQKSAGKVEAVERPPSASSQKSAGKVETVERPPSSSSQKSVGKVETVERPPSASSQKSAGKVETVERPPSASSQKSAGKVETVERPPSVLSQKSAGKVETVERPPSASSQKSAGKVETFERPPSASSQKSAGKVETVERPPSVSSQKSAGKVETVERPPSASSQKSAGKVETVERPPSASSQKSAGKVEAVERPPSASSQKSAGKVETLDRPPSASSQKSVGKVVAVERPPSASSQKSVEKTEPVKGSPSV